MGQFFQKKGNRVAVPLAIFDVYRLEIANLSMVHAISFGNRQIVLLAQTQSFIWPMISLPSAKVVKMFST